MLQSAVLREVELPDAPVEAAVGAEEEGAAVMGKDGAVITGRGAGKFAGVRAVGVHEPEVEVMGIGVMAVGGEGDCLSVRGPAGVFVDMWAGEVVEGGELRAVGFDAPDAFWGEEL